MIDESQAKSLVLRLTNDGCKEDTFVISSCELSPKEDYWVIRANSEAYVLHGKSERCYVGVNAYLVDVRSGNIERVCSAVSCEQYLQDKYDLIEARDQCYVLMPSFDKTNKVAVINLRRRIACSYPHVLCLVSEQYRYWLTGKLRVLNLAQKLLADQGVETIIGLRTDSQGAVEIGEHIWYWDALKSVLQGRSMLSK